jgi:hypothetical protein
MTNLKIKKQKFNGIALVAVLIILVSVAIIASVFALQVQVAAQSSAATLESLQKDLLVLSAQEESKAILSQAEFYDTTNHKQIFHREVKDSTGKFVGNYSFRLYDESCKMTAKENEEVSLFETSNIDIRKTVYDTQNVLYKTKNGIGCPANVNLPNNKLKETIDMFFNGNDSEKSKILFAEITDLIDDNNSLSDSGKEAIVSSRLFLNNYHEILPFAFHDYEQKGRISVDNKQTSKILHLGRVARGWAINYQDWGDSCYRYIDTKKSKVSQKSAELVFKSYGKGLKREIKDYVKLLNSFAPDIVSEFGLPGMWKGSLIKGRAWTHSNVGPNTPEFYDEWMIVEDNYYRNDEMVFLCKPFFCDNFHTNFLTEALNGLYTFGWHSWVVKNDPFTKRLPNRIDKNAVSGLLSPVDYEIDDELGRKIYSNEVFFCDAFIIRNLDPQKKYSVSIIGNPLMEDLPPIDVMDLDKKEFASIIFENGKAKLFNNSYIEPKTASDSFDKEGYIPIVFRIPRERAKDMEGLFALEIKSEDQWYEWKTISKNTVDVRDWSIGFAFDNGETQTIAKIKNPLNNKLPFITPGETMRLIQTKKTPEIISDIKQIEIENVWDGPTYRLIDFKDLDFDKETGKQTIELFLNKNYFTKNNYVNKFIRIWSADAFENKNAMRTSPLRVINNSENSLTIELPKLTGKNKIRLSKEMIIECIGFSHAQVGKIILNNDFDEIVAELNTSLLPTNASLSEMIIYNPNINKWEIESPEKRDLKKQACFSFDKPLKKPDELYYYLKNIHGIGHDKFKIWSWLNCIDFSSENITATLRKNKRYSNILSESFNCRDGKLIDLNANWSEDLWKGYYLCINNKSNSLFKIKSNSKNSLFVEKCAFPNGEWLHFSKKSLNYQIVTANGNSIIPFSNNRTKYIDLSFKEKPNAPIKIIFSSRTIGNKDHKIIIQIADFKSKKFKTLMTNDFSNGIIATPYINQELLSTQSVLKLIFLTKLKEPIYLTNFRYISKATRQNAINVNSASPKQLQEKFGWSRNLALKVHRNRPYKSFAELLMVPGMKENILLDAYPKILFHSDYWSAVITAKSGIASSKNITWLRSDPKLKRVTVLEEVKTNL